MSPDRKKPETNTIEAEVSSPEAALIERGFAPARLLSSFKYRDYRFFWSGALLSNIGTWMQMIALGWLVLMMTNSAFYVGLVNFTANAPVFFIVLFAGVAADRLDRRNLIIWTQTVMMILAFVLAFLTSAHRINIPLIVAITLATGVSTAFNFPAWQAIISDIVPRKDLLNAIALNSAQLHSARFVGPALAGIVLGVWGAASNFYLNAFSFLAVILALLAIRPQKIEKPDTKKSIRAHFMRGFHYAWRRPVIITLLSTTGLITLFGMPFVALMPIFARDILKAGAKGFGFLLAANGFGALVGALTVAYLAHTVRRETLIKIGATLFGVFLILFALSHNFWLSMIFLAGVGGSFLMTTSSINTSLQHLTPGEMRGRIMSMFVWAFLGIMPFGALIFGAIAEKFNAPLAVLIGGSVCVLTGLVLTINRHLIRQPTS